MGKMRGAVVVDIEACKGCGLCVATCPVKILELAPAKQERVSLCKNDGMGKMYRLRFVCNGMSRQLSYCLP